MSRSGVFSWVTRSSMLVTDASIASLRPLPRPLHDHALTNSRTNIDGFTPTMLLDYTKPGSEAVTHSCAWWE